MEHLLTAVVVVVVLLSSRFCEAAVRPAGSNYLNRQFKSVLNVDNGERFGEWAWVEMCPPGYFATGFSIRVERSQGRGDDTAMNGIRLYCARNGNYDDIYTVESHSGFWGDWSNVYYCPSGPLSAFQLRVEGWGGGDFDDTAANNIKFRCSSGPELEGYGMSWGNYGGWSQECRSGGICGIQTKMESYQRDGDDTSLNNVRMYCCDES